MRLSILFLCFPFFLWAQVPDSTVVDSTIVGQSTVSRIGRVAAIDSLSTIAGLAETKDSVGFLKRWTRNLKTNYPRPKTALILGLIIPGGGQIYNGSLWKVPLVYGAYGTTIYFISDNNREYKFWKDQYERRVGTMEDPTPTDDFIGIFQNSSQIREIRDEFQRRRDYSWVALIGVTIISVADAFVDCHLKNFDVSDDLSLKVKPTLTNTPGWGRTAGIGLSIPIR